MVSTTIRLVRILPLPDNYSSLCCGLRKVVKAHASSQARGRSQLMMEQCGTRRSVLHCILARLYELNEDFIALSHRFISLHYYSFLALRQTSAMVSLCA